MRAQTVLALDAVCIFRQRATVDCVRSLGGADDASPERGSFAERRVIPREELLQAVRPKPNVDSGAGRILIAANSLIVIQFRDQQ